MIDTRGMLLAPNLVATSGASSTFSLPTLARPANWSAILSIVGPSCRQGPHQGAQKSTTTGLSLCSTSCAQLSLVNCTTFALAMSSSPKSKFMERSVRLPSLPVVRRPETASNPTGFILLRQQISHQKTSWGSRLSGGLDAASGKWDSFSKSAVPSPVPDFSFPPESRGARTPSATAERIVLLGGPGANLTLPRVSSKML